MSNKTVVTKKGLLVRSLEIDETGQLSASLSRIEVSLDTSVMWLRIALDQLDQARRAHASGVDAARSGDDRVLGESLESECAAGMLAISASAFALDAFYAALKDRSPRVARIPLRSGDRRSTRYKIVGEAFRREFKVSGAGLVNLMSALSQVFQFRDYAVHPRADFALPVLKAEVNRITEWRFVSFGAPSAQAAVRAALAILVQLVRVPRNPNAEVRGYLDGLATSLDELARRWRAGYGRLTDTE